MDKRHLWIPQADAKGKRALSVPLNEAAIAVLRKQIGKHTKWVFPYNGNPVYQTTTKAWKKALHRSGIHPGFTFHGLRHTWASWHAQNSTPRHVLQELGGWTSNEMVQRYAHLGSEHLAEFVENCGDKNGHTAPKLVLVKNA